MFDTFKPLSKLIKSVLDKGSQTCKVTMTELVEYETFSCQLLILPKWTIHCDMRNDGDAIIYGVE